MWETERGGWSGMDADAVGRLDRDAVLAALRRLRHEGRPEAAARLAVAAAERLTADADLQAEAGFCLAAAGDDTNAAARFARALALDVRGALRLECLLGAGNCLRREGRLREALECLSAAHREFPRDGAARAFHALALCDHGRSRRRAAGELLALLLDTTASGRIRLYDDELRREADHLMEVPLHRRRVRPAETHGDEQRPDVPRTGAEAAPVRLGP